MMTLLKYLFALGDNLLDCGTCTWPARSGVDVFCKGIYPYHPLSKVKELLLDQARSSLSGTRPEDIRRNGRTGSLAMV